MSGMHSAKPLLSPLNPVSLRHLGGIVCVTLCLVLAACGFKMKGVSPLPFTTLYTNIAENSAFGANIRRAIIASSPQTRFVSEPADAQARLIELANNQSLRELSLDAQGRVEEYELNLEFIFQLTDAKGHVILPPTTLRSTRELPYDDSVVQAKQGEITTVFQQMQQSMVDRVVRRLASPDVAEAFQEAKSLPGEEMPANAPPLPAPRTGPGPTPWGLPGFDPGTGIH